MPIRIDMQLSSSEDLNVNMSSLFHGLLIEQLDQCPQLQDQLHISALRSYSQHLEYIDETWHWIISFTDDELFKKMWDLWLSNQNNFLIKHKNLRVTVEKKQLTNLSLKDLSNKVLSDDIATKIRLSFISPTAFKSNGRYVFMPSLEFIYGSIMRKFDATSDNVCLFDEDTLEQICKESYIQDYRLRSTRFSVDGAKVQSFVGNIVINIKHNRTMAAFINMLLTFAEYSGIGIKTSLGMGAVKFEKIK